VRIPIRIPDELRGKEIPDRIFQKVDEFILTKKNRYPIFAGNVCRKKNSLALYPVFPGNASLTKDSHKEIHTDF